MTIQKFSKSTLLLLPLEAKATPQQTGDQAAPLRQSKGLAMPGRENAQIGVWEALPGTFTRDVVAGEIMHIMSGTCTFTSEDGERMEIAEGDTLVFSPNTRGTWDIKTPLRKLYVLL